MDRFNKFFGSLGMSTIAIVALLGAGDISGQVNVIVAMVASAFAPAIVYFVPNLGDYLDVADSIAEDVAEKGSQAVDFLDNIIEQLGNIRSQ